MLIVKDLRIAFHTRNGVAVAVENLSFTLNSGEVLAIVGESGSGKSVACYSLLGLIPSPPGLVESGSAIFDGQDLLQLKEKEFREIRGRKISMIFQDPMTSLNPYMRVSDQLVETVLQHNKISKRDARLRAIEALKEVGIRDVESRLDQYPHEYSGGMRQRVMIAMALISDPDILIADEPTTALDVSVQSQILALIKNLQLVRKLSVIFITHDLGVAAQVADRVLVMKKGQLIEQGTVNDIFQEPKAAYTKELLNAVLTTAKPTPTLADSEHQPYLEVRRLNTWFNHYSGYFFNRKVELQKAVDEISLSIHRGEIVGIVGESGSGKSTLGRTIMRLVEAHSGEILLNGKSLLTLSENELLQSRRDFQMIFQDPYASLNPRMTVFNALSEPMLLHGIATPENVLEHVYSLMDDVGLDREYIRKYPHEFSGGQRQRIAIARAISVKPALIIADEPVSALDVTIRAQILKLLLALTQKHQLAMLFISHDMSVVRFLCDRVLVMQNGKLVEEGDTEEIFSSPRESYTQQLLAAIPKLN